MIDNSLWQRFLDLFIARDDSARAAVEWGILGGLGLVAFLLAAAVLGAVWRKLFRRGAKDDVDYDAALREDLEACPLPPPVPGPRRLTVYHLPVRLRLVVVAPAGHEGDVDATAVEKLLDLVLPGLGEVARQDRPRIRVWPAQFSQQGFALAFFRRAVRPEPEGHPSRWVLVAGRAQVGRNPVLVGLALWADEPNTYGQISLEPQQWRDVLRLPTGSW